MNPDEWVEKFVGTKHSTLFGMTRNTKPQDSYALAAGLAGSLQDFGAERGDSFVTVEKRYYRKEKS